MTANGVQVITAVRELWGGYWWRWYMRDGVPYAFLREEQLD